jgi:hypothetical protein
MIALVVGFLLFRVLERFVLVHHVNESDYADHRHPHVGIVSALALLQAVQRQAVAGISDHVAGTATVAVVAGEGGRVVQVLACT